MITSQELLETYRDFGRADQYRLLILDALRDGEPYPLSTVRRYTADRLYGIGQRFDAIVDFLWWTGVLVRKEESVQLSPRGYAMRDDKARMGLDGEALFSLIISACEKARLLHKLFPSVEAFDNRSGDEVTFPFSAVPLRLLPLINILREARFVEEATVQSVRLRVVESHKAWFFEQVVPKINRAIIAGGLSQLRLEAMLEEQRRCGQSAEEFIVGFEKKRLQGHPFQAFISRVSDINASAGYDVASFKSFQSVVCDRFIEVKAIGERDCFYWSAKEVATARLLGSKYYLALVRSKDTRIEGYTPLIIENPYEKFFDQWGVPRTHQGWSLTADTWCGARCSPGPAIREQL